MRLRLWKSLSYKCSLSTARSFSALVYSDHNNTKLSDATLSAITAARQLDPEVHVLVAGDNCAAVATQASMVDGVKSVILVQHDSLGHHVSENASSLVIALQKARNFSFIVGSATTAGKAIMPRVAAGLDVAQISDVIQVKSKDSFVRPIYAGNVMATVRSKDPVKVLTVRSTSFNKATLSSSAAEIETMPAPTPQSTRWVKDEIIQSERPELSSAKVVVSGGRALGSTANFALLTEMADHLGAALGASRAAVDAGYAPNDWQVGQTGKVVAPNLYIAVGISGAIQHLAGMKDSKVIVAINKDPDAAIFQVADYGVVGDLFKVVPEFNKLIKK